MSDILNEKSPGVQLAEASKEAVQYVEDSQQLQREEAEPYRFNIYKFLAISGIIVGYMADCLNTELTGNTYQGINAKIGPDPFAVWIGGMLPLVGSSFSPFVGYLSDIFGRRMFLLLGAILGALGNLGSACSNTVPKIYGTEIIIGFGILFKQVSVASIAEIFPRSWRPFVFGCFWASLAPGEGFASIIGASIMTYRSWKVIYWIPFAMNILAFFLLFLFYHPLNQHVKELGKTGWQQLASVDYVSGCLIGFGTSVALIGVQFGQFNFGWRDSRAIGCVVTGLFLLGCVTPWGYFMRTRLHYPMYPGTVVGNFRGYTLNMVPAGVLALISSTGKYMWPLLVQTLFEQHPVKAGWLASAPMIAGVFLAPAFGWIFQKFGYWSNWIITCLAALLTMFTALQAVVTPGSKAASTLLACFVNVTWTGLLVGFAAVFQLVPHRFLGTSTTTYNWLRSSVKAGGGLIFPTTLKNNLPTYLARDVATPLAKLGVSPVLIPQIIEALTSGSSKNVVLTQLSPQALVTAIDGVKWAYVHTFHIIFYSTLAWGAFGTVAAALTQNFESELTPDVEVELLEGLHFNVKHDTGEGTVISEGQWL